MKNNTSAYNKNYYILNRDIIKQKKKNYYEKNKVSKKKLFTEEEIQNKKTIHKQTIKKYQMSYSRKNRLKIIEKLGGECVKCGFGDIRALQIDHINGGGSQERKQMSNSGFYYNKILNDLNLFDKYQLLCANCNWIKRFENKE